MASFLEQVGERIRIYRESKGYTALQVACICNVSQAHISHLENGLSMPPFSVYEDVCRVIGTTMEDILAGFKWTYTPPNQEKGEVEYADNQGVA